MGERAEAKEFLLAQVSTMKGFVLNIGTDTELKLINNNATQAAFAHGQHSVLVVPTNEGCVSGVGLDMAINKLGGKEFLDMRRNLKKDDDGIALKLTEVVALKTTGGIQQNEIYFTNPPPFWDEKGESDWDTQVAALKQCYYNCLNKATQEEVYGIAFPVMCVGVNGGDAEEVHLKNITEIGLREIVGYFKDLQASNTPTSIKKVHFITYRESPLEHQLMVEAAIDCFGVDTILQQRGAPPPPG